MIWRANIAQLLLVVIIIPILCWPIKFLLVGSNPYNLLIAFQEIDYFKYIAEVIQDAQQGISSAQNINGTFMNVLNKLVIDSLGESVVGGLCVLLCFNVWGMIPVVKGIWPILPVAFSVFLGCVFLAANEKGIPISGIISSLLVVNIAFLIFRNRNSLTDFAWFIVKGVFALIFNCLISGTISVGFCTAAMLWTKRISGWFPIALMMFMGLVAVILIFLENLFNNDFEQTDTFWGL